MEKTIETKLTEIVSGFTQLPYIFVGAGLSMRYSTTLSWNELLKSIWKLLNPTANDQEYKKFNRMISQQVSIDFSKYNDDERKYYLNPQVATSLQREFNKRCLEDSEFESNTFTQEEIDDILENDHDYFKYYIAKLMKNVDINSSESAVKEVKKLKDNQNKIAGIITTNYDKLIERIFNDFDVIIGQDNLLVSNMDSIFEIFKIHGCVDKPHSIIITQEDYREFKEKLTYLSAKMLTIFVEHPVIFIGYGMGDLNIRAILKEIAKGLSSEQLEKLKHNLIFITPIFDEHTNEEIKQKEIEFDGRVITMTEVILRDYSYLYDSFSVIKSSMPVRIMRKMQNMICNFIFSTNAPQNIMVASIDNPDIEDKELGLYFGKASDVSSIGFEYYGIWEILEDILFDNKPFLLNEKIFTKTFKLIRSSASQTYLPIYKYAVGIGMSMENISKEWHIIKSIDQDILNSTDKSYTKDEKRYCDIRSIVEDYPNHYPKQLAYILLNRDLISVEELGDYLRTLYRDTNKRDKYSTQFKKLAAIYDYKKYSLQIKKA